MVQSVADNPAKKESNPEHAKFIRLWEASHFAKFQRKYLFNGGKDAKAVAKLLTSTELGHEQLIEIAAKAWDRPTEFNCKQAVTINGFAGRFNEIQSEINRPQKNDTKRVATGAVKGGVDEW